MESKGRDGYNYVLPGCPSKRWGSIGTQKGLPACPVWVGGVLWAQTGTQS